MLVLGTIVLNSGALGLKAIDANFSRPFPGFLVDTISVKRTTRRLRWWRVTGGEALPRARVRRGPEAELINRRKVNAY